MKNLLNALIAAVLMISPLEVIGQARSNRIHIYKTPEQKLVSGLLVGVADSILTVIPKSGSTDTLRICCKSIYSIRAARTFPAEIGKVVLTGAFAAIMVADDQRAESSSAAVQYDTGSAYYDALAGGIGFLLLDANSRKEPIIIQYSYERFKAFTSDLRFMLDDSR